MQNQNMYFIVNIFYKRVCITEFIHLEITEKVKLQ